MTKRQHNDAHAITDQDTDQPGTPTTAADQPIRLSKLALKALKPKQQQYVMLYLSGMTHTAIAEKLEVSRHTVITWSHEAAIIAEIARISSILSQKALQNAVLTKEDASGALSDIVRDGYSEDKDKINAVKVLGDFHGWKAPAQVNHNISGQVFGFLATIAPADSRHAIADGGFIDILADEPDTEQLPEPEKVEE